ncbi:MAG: Response regulator receiver protein [Pseudonocardia sp.]|nr:Response regulator receiver protein [Pseudonocardia sp.]
MSRTLSDRLQAGRDAATRHAWQEAVELLREADTEEALAPGDLGMLAEAAWFSGDPDLAIDARKRAFSGFQKADDPCGAAAVALQLATDHLERLESAIGNGWLGRARRLLAGIEDECFAHGVEALTLSMIAYRITIDLEESREQAKRGREIGERLNIRGIAAMGLVMEGACLVSLGKMEEGMAMIDEATLEAVSGDLDPMTTGLIYCATISVCRDVNDWGRAGEWTDAAERWCEDQGIAGFPGICRVHRSEVMQFRGSWADAEREARRACEELRRYDLIVSGRGLYEIAEVRRRVGDFDGAREAYRQSHELNVVPEPGMALLQLAEGDVAAAQASIKRALAGDRATPLGKVRMLPAAADIGLAAGDLDGVRTAVEQLDEVASTFRTTALQAAAAYARGRLQTVEGDFAAAAATLERAVQRWHEIGSPYEVARSRAALAEAYRGDGDESATVLELEAAKAAFERLGAIRDAKRVDDLLGGGGVAARGGERVTRTFVFTDIVGSTALADALGDDAWQELIRWHDQTLRSVFDRHGGTEVRHTGDGFFIVFDRPAPAVEAAVAVQRALAQQRKQHGFALRVRIGLHEAEATVRAMDYAGKGVHEAARIGALAEGGEILASRPTVAATAARFPISQPRTVELKGVAQPVEVVTVGWR